MSRPYFNVKQIYTGTGSLASYTFDFKITKLEQIRVVVVNSSNVILQNVRGDDSTFLLSVVFDTEEGGGTVTLQANLPAGYKMALLLDDAEPTQDYLFRNKTSFTLRRFEDALDAIMGAVQGFVLKAKQSLKISDMDNENAFDTSLPPGIADQGDRVLAVNSDGDGFKYGPTTTEIADAEQAALDAIAAKELAEAAAVTAEDAALEAQVLLFDGNLNINFADSPVTLSQGTYNSKIVFVDATDGDIDINLETIPGYLDGFKTQFIRTDESVNLVNIIPFGSETIDNASSYQLPKGLTVIISPDTDTNWKKKFIGLVNGGSTLPTGATEGEYLEFNGTDAAWVSGLFEGFSARYSTALSLTSIRDALLYIFQFSYLGPLVSLSASGSGTLREKGAAVTSSTLAASVTKRSTAISRIQFFLNGTSINDNNPPAQLGTGVTSYNWTGSFSDNATFRVDVTDVTDGTNGPTTVSSSASFSFVYPYYWKNGANSLTPAQVAVLSGAKQIQNNTNSQAVTYTVGVGDVVYFCYPASYGALTSIKDQNGFEAISGFTASTGNVTGLDGNAISYRQYKLTNTIGVAGTTTYTFIK